ncbi:DUF4145 domain-containing protein [Streptosporangium canum]
MTLSDPWSSVSETHFVLNCPLCGEMTSFSIEAKVTSERHSWDGQNMRFMLLLCEYCQDILIAKQEGDDDVWLAPEFLSAETKKMPRPPLHPHIPEGLRRIHEEGMTCLWAGAYTAALVMVRRILEGVCILHGFTKKTLVQNLAEMKDVGLIDWRLFEWAQALRVIGNIAAHYTDEEVAREDASDALALSEALLEYLYVFSLRFEAFKKRNPEKVMPQGQSPTQSSGSSANTPSSL